MQLFKPAVAKESIKLYKFYIPAKEFEMIQEELERKFAVLYTLDSSQDVEPRELENVLESLEKDDVILFIFKGLTYWAKILYSLIVSSQHAFEIIGPGVASMHVVTLFRDYAVYDTERYPVALKATNTLREECPDAIPWAVENLAPLISVMKVVKPE